MLFQNIKASGDGGVLHINVNNAIIFQQWSLIRTLQNILVEPYILSSYSKFKNNCAIRFNCNEATQGGAIFAEYDTVFKDIAVVQLIII